jgi:chemotaxis signal transduction protein
MRQGHESVDLLCFLIENNCFALPIHSIAKVTQMMAFSPLKADIEGCLGMVVLHGRPAYLLDISSMLNLPPREIDPDKLIIFIEEGEAVAGMVVDELKEICQINGTDLVETRSSKLISGVVTLRDEAIPILNPNTIMEMVRPWI